MENIIFEDNHLLIVGKTSTIPVQSDISGDKWLLDYCKEYIKKNPNSDKYFHEIESKRLQRAGAVIAVLSTPVDHPSIPLWEMQLSSGAVCMNLLSCAQSLGYAAQWLTEWYSYNDTMLTYLGGRVGVDKISGFIYICLLYTSDAADE